MPLKYIGIKENVNLKKQLPRITPEQSQNLINELSALPALPFKKVSHTPFDKLNNQLPTTLAQQGISPQQSQNLINGLTGKSVHKKKNILRRTVEFPFKAIREIAKPVVKILPKGLRNSLPVIGAIGGSLLAGPLGGMVGGSFGGAARGGKHPMDHALGGAALGGLSSLALSGLGGLGNLGGAGSASSGLLGNGGILSSIVGGGGGLGTLLNTGLLATSIGGAVTAKRKKNPKESETLQDAIDKSRGRRNSTSSADWNKPLRKRADIKQPPREYRGTNWNYFPSPEEQEEQLRRVNEEISQATPSEYGNQEIPQAYARGGYVEDYYDGEEGGQSDKRLIKIRPKSYIVNSTTVSLAGDGNSKNGAKIIKDWAKS